MPSPMGSAGRLPGQEFLESGLHQGRDEDAHAASSDLWSTPKQGTPSTANDAVTQELASTACIACRKSHLKCDRSFPCSRCQGLGLNCDYVASRRGYNRFQPDAAKARDQHLSFSPMHKDSHVLGGTSLSTPTTATATPGRDYLSVASPFTLLDSPSPAPSPISNELLELSSNPPDFDGADLQLGPLQAGDPSRRLPFSDECIRAFYRYLYPSHPFVPPETFLPRLAAQGTIGPLLCVMRWVGSFYLERPSANASFDEAYRLIHNPLTPRDAFLVQAIMLLVIGLDGAGQYGKGKDLLNKAKELALQIGLNTRPFAILHGQCVPVLEESWRRTWWELFILDAMFAGIHRVTKFTLFDLPPDVALPCEEWQYLSGEIPPPRYLHELEEGDFSDDDVEFSSLAYCILCARNLGRLLRAQPILGSEDENVPRIEALLAAWRLCLPRSKRDAVGGSDEVIFKAHMILYATSILLHYPLSNLDPSSTAPIRSCSADQITTSGGGFNSHTRHAIASANETSRLITHPVPLMAHTPFFTCVIALSSILHLNRWGVCSASGDANEYFLRQRIRLSIGALGEISRVWRSADIARDQVRGVAREIHLSKKERQATSELWDGFVAEQMITGMAVDEAIMEVDSSGRMRGG